MYLLGAWGWPHLADTPGIVGCGPSNQDYPRLSKFTTNPHPNPNQDYPRLPRFVEKYYAGGRGGGLMVVAGGGGIPKHTNLKMIPMMR